MNPSSKRLRIPYIREYAYSEQLAIGDPQGVKSLQQAYETLAAHIVALSPPDGAVKRQCRSVLQETFGLPSVFVTALDASTFSFASRLRTRLDRAGVVALDAGDRPESAIETARSSGDASTASSAVVLAVSTDGRTDARVRDLSRRAREQGVSLVVVSDQTPTAIEQPPRWSRRVRMFAMDTDWEDLCRLLQSPLPAARVPLMTPPMPSGFLNRGQEIAEVKSRLLRESTKRQPIALVGLGGIGKSALARVVCHDDDVIEAFDDGVLWMTFGPQPDLPRAAGSVLVALGDTVRPERMDDIEKRLGEHLNGKRCLVVVDDIVSSGDMRMLSRIGPACRVLITTRLRATAAELGADIVNVGPLSNDEALKWIERKGLKLEIATELAAKLGNVPLALELAQRALRTGLPASDLLRRLNDEGLTALDPGTTRDPTTSLFAALMLAVEALPPDDRMRLPSVATLPSGKSIPISQLAAATKLSLDDAEAMARRLADVSLAEYSEKTLRIVEPVHGFLHSLRIRQERAEAARSLPQRSSNGSIWISYRRDDSGAHAGRLYDRLTSRLGLDRVFLDVDSIAVGMDFVEAIETRIQQVSTMLVVIGPRWMSASNRSGERRLDDPDDFVRREIEVALQNDVPVIPVLVGGVSMPKAGELPPSLQALTRRNALELSDISYQQDVDRLIAAIDSLISTTPRGQRERRASQSRQSKQPPSAAPVHNAVQRFGIWATATVAVVLLVSLFTWNWFSSRSNDNLVRVPTVIGLSTPDLAKLGTELGIRFVLTDGQKEIDFVDGVITAQLPIPDTQIERGRTVTVTVAPRPVSPVPLFVRMEKGGGLIEGSSDERVGQQRDGVVTSLSVSFRQTEPELQLKREMFYMTDTGRSDGGGPIMETASTGAGDAQDRVRFPKGVRGVKFWLEGTRSKQYTVRYEVLLSNGAGGEARDGSPAGDWTPRTSSTQHQLVWLLISVVPRAEATTR